MRKLIVLIGTFCLTLPVCRAQLRAGLIGGIHSASILETNDLPGWDSLTDPYNSSRTAVHIGLMAEIPLGAGSRWFLHPGMIYHGKGRQYAQSFDTAMADTASVSRKFFANYIDIPFNLTYKLPLGKKASFLLSAGPYASFFYNGTRQSEYRVKSGTSLAYSDDEENLQVGKGADRMKTFDFGVNGRAGFEIGNVWLTGYFSQGLTDFYTASYDASYKHRLIGASLTVWFSKAQAIEKKEKVKPPKDTDGDGIPDLADACPTEAGTAVTKGCPDRDGDGIADKDDHCPDVAGLARYKGCPIPDSDGDGINDEEDKCPQVAGIARYQGCPIPDRDGDGVNDEEDKCPDQAGPRSNHGCPVIEKEVIEKVNTAARSILFEKNSIKLSAKSYHALDELAAILAAHPEWKLQIEGYTDNTGTPALNLKLSQQRVDEVKAYLVKKGIEDSRLEAKGYGQVNPIADNSTPEGRNKNRRVELKLVQ